MQYRLIGIILIILFSFTAERAAIADQVVYLIRHAEQVLDVEDPPLTDEGQLRAKAWASLLRDADIKVIYTSQKSRTMQTGEQVVQALNIPMETMSRRDVQGLVARINARHVDDAVLVIGHSGTIPKLLKELGYSEDVTIEKADYDNLFIILPQSEGDPIVLRLRYQ